MHMAWAYKVSFSLTQDKKKNCTIKMPPMRTGGRKGKFFFHAKISGCMIIGGPCDHGKLSKQGQEPFTELQSIQCQDHDWAKAQLTTARCKGLHCAACHNAVQHKDRLESYPCIPRSSAYHYCISCPQRNKSQVPSIIPWTKYNKIVIQIFIPAHCSFLPNVIVSHSFLFIGV